MTEDILNNFAKYGENGDKVLREYNENIKRILKEVQKEGPEYTKSYMKAFPIPAGEKK